MDNERRVNVGALARQFQKDGYIPHADPRVQVFTPNSDEAFHAYGALKPELYALSAIVSDRIVQRAYDARLERPPFGLVTVGRQPAYFVHVGFDRLKPNAPFSSIRGYIRGTLMFALAEERAAIEAGTVTKEVASIYKRLEQLLAYRDEITPAFELHNNWGKLMEGGITTSAQVMSEILEVIPQVYAPTNPEKLTQVARNSEPLVNFFAAQHGEVFFGGIADFKTPPIPISGALNPEFFKIEGEGDKERLALSETGKRKLNWRREKMLTGSTSARHEPTVGCPALFNLGEGSGIKKLWNWHVDIAEKVYPRLGRATRPR